MDKLESNIARSFRLAKKDIYDLKNRVNMLTQEYEVAMDILKDLKPKRSKPRKARKKKKR